jgi:hypothetical protein
MTDRELLEAAAKAAGYLPNNNWQWSERAGSSGAFRYRCAGEWIEWNPLTDDGDALRLAVRLYLWEAIRLAHREVSNEVDIYAATRRAIVRAAAAMVAK